MSGLRTAGNTVRKKVLVVEDQWLVARQISLTIERMGMEPIGPVATGQGAVTMARTSAPDLVVMDIVLDGTLDGVAAGTQIWREQHLPVVYVTGFTDKEILTRAVDSGAVGIIVKPFTEPQLTATLMVALRTMPTADADATSSEAVVTEACGSCALAYPEQATLSERERQIVGMLCTGERVASIAGHLTISPHTVRNHLKSAFRKLGLHSQHELVRY